MSHHSIYKTNVKVNVETLKKAVNKLAEELGVKSGNIVLDYNGRAKSVAIALYPNELRNRGIGFDVKDGELVVVGDKYGVEKYFGKYSELVANYINTYLVKKRVYKLYPNAKVRETIREAIVELEVEI